MPQSAVDGSRQRLPLCLRRAQHCGTDLTLDSCRSPPGHHDRVTDMDLVLQALAERGLWRGSNDGDAELVPIEIRRAARKAGIRVRTIVDGRGRPRPAPPTAGRRTSRGEELQSTPTSPE